MNSLPDVQGEAINSPIRKVGIRGHKKILQMMGKPVHAEISTYVNLKEGRGVHMSRFLTSLKLLEKITTANVGMYLGHVREKQGAEISFLTLRFEQEVLDQFVKFRIDSNSRKDAHHTMEFTFQIIATCPCSLEMCKSEGRGVPHMQRGFVTVCISVRFIEDVVPVVTSCMAEFASLLPQSFVKRDKEHAIAVKCEANPIFVEDVVRRVKGVIETLETVQDFYVVAEHEESIHTHNAVAVDSKYNPVSHPLE